MEYITKIENYFGNVEYQRPPGSVRDSAAIFARFLGFRAFHVFITTNGCKQPVEKCENLDPSVHEEIAHLLTALATC